MTYRCSQCGAIIPDEGPMRALHADCLDQARAELEKVRAELASLRTVVEQLAERLAKGVTSQGNNFKAYYSEAEAEAIFDLLGEK